MYSKIITESHRYYTELKDGALTAYIADMVQQSWSCVVYNSQLEIETFWQCASELNMPVPITKEEFDTAKLRYKEFTNKIK